MTNALLAGLPPVHPGAILREDAIPALNTPIAAVARALGISRQQLYDLLAEKRPVTAAMAIRLGKLLGNGPALWLNMQSAYDLAVLSADMADEVAGIPTLAVISGVRPLAA